MTASIHELCWFAIRNIYAHHTPRAIGYERLFRSAGTPLCGLGIWPEVRKIDGMAS
jgi:hypothetical protein